MNLTSLLNFESVMVKGAHSQSEALDIVVATSIKVIIEEFFKKMAPSFIIVLSCRRKSPYNFFLAILELLFNMVYHMNVQLVYIDGKNPQRIEGPRLYNLILVDSFEAFLDIDVISYTRNYTTNEYYQIFLMQRDRHMFRDMEAIFKYCWTNNIVNCNIQNQNALGEVYMYTYFPFTYNNCDSVEPKLINTFDGDSWINKTIFHSKLKNFYGCPLVAFVRDIAPFSFVSQNDDGDVFYDGFEIDLMKYLAKKMNFKLDLRISDTDDRSHPAGSGALKMISEYTADIAFGFYRRRPGLDTRFTTTFPHYQNNIVAVIYLPAFKLNAVEIFLFPFKYKVWCALTLTVLSIFGVLRAMRKSQINSISIFSMIACTLGVPVQQEPKMAHSVLIFLTWLWSSFVIRTIYSGMLFHLLRHQIFSFIPHSLDQAFQNNLHAVMNEFTYNDVIRIPIYENSHNLSSIVINTKNEFSALTYIERNKSRNLYAVISFEFLLYFLEEYDKFNSFYVIPETIMRQQLSIYLSIHSFLINQFDWEMMFIHAVGLIKFWKDKYITPGYFTKKNLYWDTWFVQEDLWSIYALCGIFYIIALMIFLIEILSLKIKFLKRLFE